ncbi:MAG: alpha-amylase [Deltaproteobacteria bacterium]|jgi:glycosidase|nr:alpha-amylase [Deltaproteobacteria bacterium]
MLLNRQSVARLAKAGLAEQLERPFALESARRIAGEVGQNGTSCYLLALVMTAMRLTAERYLAQREYRSQSNVVEISGRPFAVPKINDLLTCFAEEYPLPKTLSPTAFGGRTSSLELTADMYLLQVQCGNPAAQPFHTLFSDHALIERIDYRKVLDQLTSLLAGHAADLFWRQPLPQLLQAPLFAAPNALSGQLAFILKHWAAWLPEDLQREMVVAQAVAVEEARPRGPGPGPVQLPEFATEARGFSADFTPDSDWMSSTVLIAKSIYVWLDQLSRRYGRQIGTLWDIPDSELDKLADSGFNALWLIGIWERSPASRKIKQLRGNPEAEASAYALFAYRIAQDLGGEDAMVDFEQRCHVRGIRLACDIVPNHTGIDSEWSRQHPDWFLQCDHPPYPDYRFNGPDLCDHPDLSIRVEDGYWDHSNAAVVFEHLDHRSGQRRYIYHGNDGTHMPWNDTAQLNFLLADVRKAMSDLIVQIARRFRLIRFDAAMTLARKHYRRLWFPPPGGSAGVPSRSVFWLDDADFDRAFPKEFWREVVDRVKTEAPDTLLIAEAFWLMESYFVRTLGMHRVYNSAFMHMLKNEDNVKFQKLLRDTLAYNPEILKRYVNFMNNPDEATAVAQFGKGNKYFGVAVLLSTLPGLPMFGHGQVEGLEEKYGMEYRRAYWDETPDEGFIAYHRSQIFPLLRQRKMFAGVEHFAWYPFETDSGSNPNVFAFSNGTPENQFLIIYNNAPDGTRGRLHQSAPKAAADREGVALPGPSLSQALRLDPHQGPFCRVRNARDQTEQLWSTDQLQTGLELHLNGYQYEIFHQFQILTDPAGNWQRLYQSLDGRAVANLDLARLRMQHHPVWQSFQALMNPDRLLALSGMLMTPPLVGPGQTVVRECAKELDTLAALFSTHLDLVPTATTPSEQSLRQDMVDLSTWLGTLAPSRLPGQILLKIWQGSSDVCSLGPAIIMWRLLAALGQRLSCSAPASLWAMMQRLGLDHAWHEVLSEPGDRRNLNLSWILLEAEAMDPHPARSETALAELVGTSRVATVIGLNEYAGERFFNREGMMALCAALAIQADWTLGRPTGPGRPGPEPLETFRGRLARAAAVGYRLDNFIHLE